MVCDHLKDLRPLLDHFNIVGKSMSETFQFWLEYCDMAFLLFDFLAAERESNWDLHLETFQEMLKYDRAFGQYKYFTWGSIYIIDMLELPVKHPELYQHFVSGFHTVSRCKKESKFNCVSTDMALEQSMNRHSKTKGGIVGVSQDLNAVEKWTLTSHLRATVHSNFKEICGMTQINQEKELTSKAIATSDKCVKSIVEVIDDQFVNPFTFSNTEKTVLINIVSGSVVKEELRSDILNAKAIGKKAADEYIQTRIIERTTPFWDPIKKLNISTFATGDIPIKLYRKNEAAITLKGHHNLFLRLITVSASRQIDLKSVLSYELAAVPLSLFHPTGEMQDNQKPIVIRTRNAWVFSQYTSSNGGININT